ncbi:unnamed protein product, partial [Laminaria digitata]
DKNPDKREEATEVFRLISEAYEVLGDPEKKNNYDRYGHRGQEEGMPAGYGYGFNQGGTAAAGNGGGGWGGNAADWVRRPPGR